MTTGEEKKSLSFVEQFVKEDLEAGKNGGRLQTRFPPEPNGYIHIGHAKAICMDFGVAEEFGGVCNLRFDDTNPTKENTEYVENIMSDIKWLGFKWGTDLGADSRAEGYAHTARTPQSVPRPPHRGEPAPVRADEHAGGR